MKKLRTLFFLILSFYATSAIADSPALSTNDDVLDAYVNCIEYLTEHFDSLSDEQCNYLLKKIAYLSALIAPDEEDSLFDDRPSPGYKRLDQYFARSGYLDKIAECLQARSIPYEIGTRELANGKIGFINGINNTEEESQEYASRISEYARGAKVYGIYNTTRSTFTDVIESVLGYFGVQAPPVQLLKDQWEDFISTHGENAKFLQVCYSGGTIHVLNALLASPKNIRDKVIVLAISPGAIVPNKLCFRSYNYASRRDIIPALDVRGNVEYGDELTLLDPYPGTRLLDHSFLSPTFESKVSQNVKSYMIAYGKN